MGPWLGVDVGGTRKRFDVALIDDHRVLELAGGLSCAEVVELAERERPTVVAIDSPRCCAQEGQTARDSERQLAKEICGIRWTPDESRVRTSAYYEWIVEGLKLYGALATLDPKLIEVFPTASWTRWLGKRTVSRSVWTTRGLTTFGLEGVPARTNQDQRDAIAAAVTAQQHERGMTEAIGEIVVPAHRRDDQGAASVAEPPRRVTGWLVEPDARWEAPLELAELGELNAQWLEGLIWGPWQCGAPIDDETLPLVPQLATMNRAGYITDFSQPGRRDPDCPQRAAVSGYCQEARAECLVTISLDSELIVIAHHDSSVGYLLPVTQCDGCGFTWLPGPGIGDVWEGIHPQTARRLAECWYMEALDPVWGRNDRLWPGVLAALLRDPQECAGALNNPDLLDHDADEPTTG